MKAATRQAIRRRATWGAGWLTCVALVSGCSSAGTGTTGTAGSAAGAATTAVMGAPSPARSATAQVSETTHGAELVVSGAVPRARLREVARDARTAISRVRQVWGDSVLTGRVPIEVAADEADFRRRGGNAEGGDQIAATTTPDDRVVLAPSLFTRVTSTGRVVVLTHELTHLALHQAGRHGIRRWVVEGSAEFTAYRSTRLSMSRLAPQLAGEVRAGHAPAGPPGDARFDSEPATAYQEAYAWCAFLVHRFGLQRFTRFVRSADEGGAAEFATAFGVSSGSLRAAYGQFLREQLSERTPSSTNGG